MHGKAFQKILLRRIQRVLQFSFFLQDLDANIFDLAKEKKKLLCTQVKSTKRYANDVKNKDSWLRLLYRQLFENSVYWRNSSILRLHNNIYFVTIQKQVITKVFIRVKTIRILFVICIIENLNQHTDHQNHKVSQQQQHSNTFLKCFIKTN